MPLVKFRVTFFLSAARRRGDLQYRRVMEVSVPEEIAGDLGEIGRYIRDQFFGAPEFVKVIDAVPLSVEEVEVVGVEDVGSEAPPVERPRDSIPDAPAWVHEAFDKGQGAVLDGVNRLLNAEEARELDGPVLLFRGGVTIDMDGVAGDREEVVSAMRSVGFPANRSFDWRRSANGRAHVRFHPDAPLTPTGVFKLRLALGDDARRVLLDLQRYAVRREDRDIQGILFAQKGERRAGPWHPAALE